MNGRIQFIQPPNPLTLSNVLFYTTPANQETTTLSKTFFSPENVQLLQNAIRGGVYRMSNQEFVIAQQPSNELNMVMRAMYLQHAVNQPHHIADQIQALNATVIAFCVPKLYGEARQYLTYLEDASKLPVPLALPKECGRFKQLDLPPP